MAESFDHVSPYNYGMNNPILMTDLDGMAADTAGKVTPQPKPNSGGSAAVVIVLALNEVSIVAKPLARTMPFVTAGAISWSVGWNFGRWQSKPENNLAFVDGNKLGLSQSNSTEKAGSGTQRKKSPAQLRKEWEEANSIPWPTEPGNPTKKQVAHHKIPLTDGGEDGMPNIEPLPQRDHTDLHKKNGDFKRRSERKNNN